MSNRTVQGREHSRVLIYSHDTFGLGHLRRCRTIAHALVERHKNLSVLILSGSPIIGSFDFRSRVDFVRIPGVIKLRNGEYTSLNLHIDIDEMLAMRASIIRHTAEIFDPDLFIVDKEPLGLRGEVLETLQMLKARGTPLVLGLRDVMDEPSALAPEWERKKVLPALDKLYDELWVYGLPQICDPLDGIKVPPSVRRKMVYTGYLERSASPHADLPDMPEDPFILVTPGGGGDGEDMVDWVLRAYEADRKLPHRALIVLGPFMNRELQNEFLARAAALPMVEALTFESQLESLMAKASGVVAMGGYNTFCEILSFDKKALIVPRMVPRLEQFIRASRAQELGLVSMLPDDGVRDAHAMATALRQLPQQQAPSDVIIPGLLDGLENVNRLAERHLSEPRRPARRTLFRRRA
ncbi:putative glycosyltransferase [Skermanella aerolata]|uniref:Membrane protein n=1 Tax=Skermanella aerolata TaxID=393310 RepID=A0A512DNV4_9PROT|nr:glycosyltransferase [Skermanella aerolata]KJB95843.1 membrane protein [Skermanella aerolata KACC 11604]GEO38138.1 membrane protein [Skermanella aerolata]